MESAESIELPHSTVFGRHMTDFLVGYCYDIVQNIDFHNVSRNNLIIWVMILYYNSSLIREFQDGCSFEEEHEFYRQFLKVKFKGFEFTALQKFSA